ncbi:MAG: hypothetical protein II336_17945 [Loktanella sp.]|nr:hypothetical protein [Loktanella sp.]
MNGRFYIGNDGISLTLAQMTPQQRIRATLGAHDLSIPRPTLRAAMPRRAWDREVRV